MQIAATLSPANRQRLEAFLLAAHLRAAQVERRTVRSRLKPPPNLTLSQWAERNIVLSREAGARPGPFSADEAPYQREPMDVIGDRRYPRVILMWSSQVGKTVMCTIYAMYTAHQDPGPFLIVQPTLMMAERYSKGRIAPMIRDSPALSVKFADPRSRDSGNTLLYKEYEGGVLAIAGANSASGLASLAMRDLYMDEVDRFPKSAGKEGRPSAIAESRASTYDDAKIIKSSSPTIEGESEIEEEWLKSDRREYYVPCPHCQHEQRLVFGGSDVPHGIKWDAAENGALHAFYVCEACHAVIEEYEKRRMLAHGRWLAGNPESPTPGFRITALYSPFFSWKRLVDRWLRDKDTPLTLEAFLNTMLCELWRPLAGEKMDANALADRLEAFQPRAVDENGEETLEADRLFVPAGAGVIVRTVDTQGDRLETTVWAFGEKEEMWPIDFDLIPGDPSIPFGSPMSPWNELDRIILGQNYRHASGAPMRCFPTFIDSGGHAAGEVYAFTKDRNWAGVFAIKGLTDQTRGPLLGKPTRNNRAKAILYPVGSYTAKESFWKRLAKITKPGPGYVHLPDWMSGEQVSQLTNENLVRKIVGGQVKYMWLQKGPTEFFHMGAYALCALQYLPLGTRKNLGALAAQLVTQGAAQNEQPAAETSAEEADDDTSLRQKRSPDWINGWRH